MSLPAIASICTNLLFSGDCCRYQLIALLMSEVHRIFGHLTVALGFLSPSRYTTVVLALHKL